MAASLRAARRSLHLFNSTPNKVFKRYNYIVLLPEVPADTSQTNPLLETNSLPQFTKITSKNYYNGITKTLLEYETGIKRLEEKCQDPKQEISFENLVYPIEDLLMPFDNAWSTLKNQVSVKHTEPDAKVFWRLHSRVLSSRSSHFNSKPIYHAFKEINADRSQLNNAQKRVVDKFLLEAKLGGIELSGSALEHFKNVHMTLENEKKSYKMKLNEATKRFKHPIKDPNVVRDFPPELLHALAENKLQPSQGPWHVTLHDDIYESFMKHCPDRDLRWNVLNARNTRCSLTDKEISNSLHIEEIRFQRKAEATLLGFDSFAEMSMMTKMAQNLDNVQSMITTLKVKAKPMMEKEVTDLKSYAQESGFDETFQEWDVPYWRRKQRISKYRLDLDEVREYFPLEKVLCGLFELCQNLFGIQISENTENVNTWDESVKFYDVYENGIHKASFYYDMYVRPQEKLQGAWVEVSRSRCDSLNSKPVAYLVTNFCPPLGNQPSLLSFKEVESLFKQFGKVLQHLLTDGPYMEVSGLSNIEWDAVNTTMHFMSHWLQDYSIMKMISSHYQEQRPLPEELFNKLHEEKLHMSRYDLMHQLYISDFDLTIYSSKEFWLDVCRRLHAEYHCFPMDKNDCHPCSLPMIVSDEYPAAYYSFLWSEMIAADAYEAFKEIDCSDPEKLRQLGQRFRDCFLSLGGSCHSSEIFRMFRGRDPSPDAILKKYKISDDIEH